MDRSKISRVGTKYLFLSRLFVRKQMVRHAQNLAELLTRTLALPEIP